MATKPASESTALQLTAEQRNTQIATTNAEMFPVLAYEQQELSDLIEDNLGGQLPRLQRVPWPTGGNTQFKVETDEGAKRYDSITGIIVHHIANRIFWKSTFEESGGGQPPDCQSPDGIHGYGIPEDPDKTGLVHPALRATPSMRNDPNAVYACSMCPLGKFSKDARPRCGERHPLFTVPQSEDPEDINLLPLIVSVPPSSLGVWSDFSGRLLQKGVSFRRAIVDLSLEEAMGGPTGKIAYSKLVVRRVGTLTLEQFAFMRRYAQDLAPLFERFRREAVEVADLDDAPVTSSGARVVKPDDIDPGGDGSEFVNPVDDTIDDFAPIP